MKLELQPREDHQVKIIAEFDSAALESYKHRAARKISQQTKIPGFRPGKAPYDVIRRHVGDEALIQQAVEDLIDAEYANILKEADIKPAAAGALDEIVSMDPPKFSFVVPLEPKVELGAYNDVRMDYNLEAVTEEDINEFLNRMQTSYATAEPVERPAENGDLVYLMLSGKLTTPADGEEAIVFPERPAQFIIGNDVMQEKNWPFPGFTDQLVGMSANDSKTMLHTFSNEEEDESIKGKEVEFSVTVQSIKALHLPDLDDSFAQTVGQFETIADLQAAIRRQLEETRRQETDDKFFVELIDKIIEQATIKYPPQILEDEVEHTLNHLKEDLERQGMELDTYFKMINSSREAYVEEQIRPMARKRVERSLVLDEIGRAEKIELNRKDYEEAINSTVMELSSMPKPKGQKRVSDDVINAMTMNAVSRKYNQLILRRLKSLATGQPEETTEPVEEPKAEETPETGAAESTETAE